MKKEHFYKKLEDLLEIEDKLGEETVLKDYEEFDSLAIMSIVALTDKFFSKKLSPAQLESITNTGSLMDIIGREHFED